MSSQTTAPEGKSENLWAGLIENRKKRRNAWDNARLILVDVPLNLREVKKILPLGLWPSDPPMATLFLIDYPTVAYPLFPYKEAIMMIHVRTLLGQGRHCCWIIVDDDPALILGRELLGFPKKTGDFVFEEEKDTISASITRRGVTVMSMTAMRGGRESSPPPVFNHKLFNYGGLGQFMAFSPVWLFRPKEVIHESWQADITLTLNPSDFDPLARLVDGKPRNGRIVTLDIPGGSPYMLPVGLAGPFLFGRTFNLRFR
jgi:acetoacetate decarboxylase